MLSLLIFHLNYHFAYGVTIAIRAPQADPIAFAAYVATESQVQSYSDYLIDTKADSPNRQLLKDFVARGQREFMGGKIKDAIQFFQSAMDLRTREDWSQEDRLALQYCALRLAQLSQKPIERRRWLELARSLSPKVMDSTLFPPPLVQQFSAIKPEATWPLRNLNVALSDYRYLFIDGRAVNLDKEGSVLIDGEPHRFTLVSDHVQRQSMIGTWIEFKNWLPPATPLIVGQCDAFKADTSLPSNTLIFFADDCVRDIKPVPTLASSQLLPDQPASPLSTSFEKVEKSFIKSKWTWVAAGAVVAGIILYNQQRESDHTQPSTTFGF